MSTTENPQAFPSLAADEQGNFTDHPGMSLRDWFAGQALAHPRTWDPDNPAHTSSKKAAEWAYQLADAMLAERAKVSINSCPDLIEALQRIVRLTPGRANSASAHDLHLTVKAIAETALAKVSK